MRTAVYAGTFDPITNGHLDIAVRASRLFDQVVMAIAEDNYKQPLFHTEERCALVRESMRGVANVRVDAFSGLLVDYCQSIGAQAVIRGLRAVSDFEKEFQMALMNHKLNKQIEMVFLMSDAEYLYVSSSLIKNSAELGGSIDDLVPPAVAMALREKYHIDS